MAEDSKDATKEIIVRYKKMTQMYGILQSECTTNNITLEKHSYQSNFFKHLTCSFPLERKSGPNPGMLLMI